MVCGRDDIVLANAGRKVSWARRVDSLVGAGEGRANSRMLRDARKGRDMELRSSKQVGRYAVGSMDVDDDKYVEIGYIYIRGNPAPTPSHVICEGNYFDLNYVVIITRFCTTVSNSKWPRLHRDMHGHLLLFGRRSASNAPLDPKHCIQATNAMTSDQTIHLSTGVIPAYIE
jgi:hypothetical protein